MCPSQPWESNSLQIASMRLSWVQPMGDERVEEREVKIFLNRLLPRSTVELTVAILLHDQLWQWLFLCDVSNSWALVTMSLPFLLQSKGGSPFC